MPLWAATGVQCQAKRAGLQKTWMGSIARTQEQYTAVRFLGYAQPQPCALSRMQHELGLNPT